MVGRLRLEGDVEATRGAIARWFAARGRDRFTWCVGDLAVPHDLASELLDLGATPDPEDPILTCMTLTEEPPAVPGVETRVVRDYDEFATTRELTWDAFGIDESARVLMRSRLPEVWTDIQKHSTQTWVALIDNEIVATAAADFLGECVLLAAGATAPHARGRGAYRALVRARWDAAVRSGTPALVAQAGQMSRSILERLGFRELGRLRVLVDRT